MDDAHGVPDALPPMAIWRSPRSASSHERLHQCFARQDRSGVACTCPPARLCLSEHHTQRWTAPLSDQGHRIYQRQDCAATSKLSQFYHKCRNIARSALRGMDPYKPAAEQADASSTGSVPLPSAQWHSDLQRRRIRCRGRLG